MQPSNRKQDFFTLDTRITIQRGNIYQKKVKYSEIGEYRFIMFAAFCFLVFLTIDAIREGNDFEIFQGIVRLVIYVIVFGEIFKNIYKTFFIKTWKSIIPLKHVKNITTKPLDNGLETEVVLHLQNGRKKFYIFRNAEGQMEPFMAALSEQAPVSSPVALQ